MEALNVDEEEITPTASLQGDLGAESIDFLDLVFRLERRGRKNAESTNHLVTQCGRLVNRDGGWIEHACVDSADQLYRPFASSAIRATVPRSDP